MSKSIEQYVEQWVEDMDTEALFTWAGIFGVVYDKESWLDDEYPEKENELRVKLVAAVLTFRQTEQLNALKGTRGHLIEGVNCRNFKCVNNKKGGCSLNNIVLEPQGALVKQVRCIEADEGPVGEPAPQEKGGSE